MNKRPTSSAGIDKGSIDSHRRADYVVVQPTALNSDWRWIFVPAGGGEEVSAEGKTEHTERVKRKGMELPSCTTVVRVSRSDALPRHTFPFVDDVSRRST